MQTDHTRNPSNQRDPACTIRECNVVIGHTHQQQEGWSEDGLYRAVGLGCMRDPGKTAYMKRHATKFPKWNQGFGMWFDGEYKSFIKRGTNWRNTLGEELYEYLVNPSKNPALAGVK